MKINIVFDSSFGAKGDPRDGDVFVMIESADNRALAEHLGKRSGSEAVIFFFEPDPSVPSEKVLLARLRHISDRFPDWTEIECIGLAMNLRIASAVTAPHESSSGLYIVPSSTTHLRDSDDSECFKLTKTPPPSIDRADTTKSYSFPRHSLAMTDRARDRIIEIRDYIQSQEPDNEIVPTLSWGPRMTRGPHEADWHDHGVGFSLGFFNNRSQFIGEYVDICNGFEIVFRLGADLRPFEGKKSTIRKAGVALL